MSAGTRRALVTFVSLGCAWALLRPVSAGLGLRWYPVEPLDWLVCAALPVFTAIAVRGSFAFVSAAKGLQRWGAGLMLLASSVLTLAVLGVLGGIVLKRLAFGN